MPESSARTIASLQALADGLTKTVPELEALVDRADALRTTLEGGTPLGEAMAAEIRPLMITMLTRITERLHEIGSEVRRAEAHQLREEGYTHERIAATFGVTRQRAAALLKPAPGNSRPEG